MVRKTYGEGTGRAQAARSNVTGKVPTTLAAGALAINTTDKKIYIGDLGNVPVRFAQWLEEWVASRDAPVTPRD